MNNTLAWAEQFIDVPPEWAVREESLSLLFGLEGPRLSFHLPRLKRWRNGEFPKHSLLRLVPHCGVEVADYAEYLVDLEHIGQWPRDKPLSFRVGGTLVRLGAVSAATALILEPHYRLKQAYQDEFYETLSSIQIRGSLKPREDAQAALFYLNSDYLRPVKAAARILHLIPPSDVDKDAPPFGPLASRKLVRTRPAIGELVPVQLYNAAASSSGEPRFLGFYRVLEFFFGRARKAELAAARRDPSLPDSTFFKRIREERGEIPQLQAAIRSALTPAEKQMLVSFANHHQLAKCSSIDDVSKALYDFRNSIVHAKEEEAHRSRVPDPFRSGDDAEKWPWVAEFLAGKCIRRLGSA